MRGYRASRVAGCIWRAGNRTVGQDLVEEGSDRVFIGYMSFAFGQPSFSSVVGECLAITLLVAGLLTALSMILLDLIRLLLLSLSVFLRSRSLASSKFGDSLS